MNFTDGYYVFADANNKTIHRGNVITNGSNCEFDVYGVFSNEYIPKDNAGSSGNFGSNTNGFECNNFDDYFKNSFINSSYTGSTYSTGTDGIPRCHFSIPADCSTLNFTDGYFVFADANNKTIHRGNVDVTPAIPGTPQGITFTCDTNSDIKYNYSNFDVSFENSRSNSDKSYLIFTPKSTSTGTQHLGNSTNGDGSINSPFVITHIDKQSGAFYIEPICDVDGNSKPVLLSVLDNVVLG